MPFRKPAYRHRIKIESATTTRDDYGDTPETWGLWPKGSNGFRHASVTPLGGGETDIGGALVFVGTFEVRTRYRTGFTTGMRITHNGRVMHISQVVNVDERNREIVLQCEEVAS